MPKRAARFFDVIDETGGVNVEIAHAVSAKTASELSGIPIAWIEDRVVRFGALGIAHSASLGGEHQDLLVRRSNDEP